MASNPQNRNDFQSIWQKLVESNPARQDAYANFEATINPNGSPTQKTLDELLSKPAVNFDVKDSKTLLEDLQANIVKHHRCKHVRYLFLNFKTRQENAVKNWISGLNVTSAFDHLTDLSLPKNEITVFTTFHLTYSGYKYLGIPEKLIPGSEAFKVGQAKRTTFPKGNIDPSFDPDLHAILMVASSDSPKLVKQVDNYVLGLKALIDGSIKIQKGDTLYEDKAGKQPIEWFGYADGISQPFFFPDAQKVKYSKYLPLRQKRISSLKLVLVSDPGGQYWCSCGSFMTFLKLEQNVKAFEEQVAKVAGELQTQDMDLAGAYIIGRFKDGTPVTLYSKPLKNAKQLNWFDYTEVIQNGSSMQTDEAGSRCPFHAHIRKANPRLPGSEEVRIVRRGIPYDDRTEDAVKSDKPEGDVGLLFVSFQRSLEDQFEHILHNWMHNNYTGDIKSGKDVIMADNQLTACCFTKNWNSSDPDNKQEIQIKDALVVMKTGFYLFTPSLSFLTSLSPGKLLPKKNLFDYTGLFAGNGNENC